MSKIFLIGLWYSRSKTDLAKNQLPILDKPVGQFLRHCSRQVNTLSNIFKFLDECNKVSASEFSIGVRIALANLSIFINHRKIFKFEFNSWFNQLKRHRYLFSPILIETAL